MNIPNPENSQAGIFLDQSYWNSRYETNDIVWDLGQVSPPIKAYIDQLTNKELKILIIGCGNAHEADYLLEQGFRNITVLDFAPLLVQNLQEKYANNQYIKVLLVDFFEHQGQYDLILEQTLFCAIDPKLRPRYALKINELLAKKGTLAGVMFGKEFDFAGPPFGGTAQEYETYFKLYFDFKTFEPCYNSVKTRQGKEIFVILTKK